MRAGTVLMAGCAAAVVLAGCKKTDDSKANFTRAIDTYYASRPACLWPQAIKLPAQVNTSDTSQTSGYDALVDQGLLQRTTAEKREFIIASKQVTNYDLTDKGHSLWTADTTQPGFGNFCYGKRSVTSIDSYTPTSQQPGATTTVNYHAGISGAPGWATAAETENAFPQVRADLSGPSPASATLADTSSGWAVTNGPAGPLQSGKSASAADGQIVQ